MRGIVVLALFGTILLAQAPTVPFTLIQISGSQTNQNGSAVTYRAYQVSPDDGFRIVCQDPCPLDPNLINTKYAGMLVARQKLLQLTGGVDHVPEGAPFDYHIMGDSFCGPYTTGLTGDAGFYVKGGSFGCFWDVEKNSDGAPFNLQNAGNLDRQLLFVHEYGHTIFYQRHFSSYEDAVKAFSIYVAGIQLDSHTFVASGTADFCDPDVGFYMNLIHDLCIRNGFQPSDFAPAMRELDRQFQAGLGTFYPGSGGKPVTSILQFRHILESLLGSNTRDAFLQVGYTPLLAGDDGILLAAGGQTVMAGGLFSLQAPPGSVTVDTAIWAEDAFNAPNIANFSFDTTFRLEPSNVTLARPLVLTLQYDPAKLPAGTQESRLKLFQVATPTTWQLVAGQQLNTTAHTITVPIAAFGQFGYFVQ